LITIVVLKVSHGKHATDSLMYTFYSYVFNMKLLFFNCTPTSESKIKKANKKLRSTCSLSAN